MRTRPWYAKQKINYTLPYHIRHSYHKRKDSLHCYRSNYHNSYHGYHHYDIMAIRMSIWATIFRKCWKIYSIIIHVMVFIIHVMDIIINIEVIIIRIKVIIVLVSVIIIQISAFIHFLWHIIIHSVPSFSEWLSYIHDVAMFDFFFQLYFPKEIKLLYFPPSIEEREIK